MESIFSKLDIEEILKEIAGLPIEKQREIYKLAQDRCYDRRLCEEAGIDYINPDLRKAIVFEYFEMKKRQK